MRKKTKRHVHSVVTKKVSPNHRSVKPDKKSIMEIYDRYYKEQVTALYKVVQEL
ncbi:hypothetical protein ACFL5E_00915 [Candidatus Omnitrophota bacterium]